MSKQIHSDHWHMLTSQQIVELFNNNFSGVTIAPSEDIVMRCKIMEIATLECLENRTLSTIYRIRQTGEVYQLTRPRGEILEYDNYESYLAYNPIDEPLEIFTSKDPVHVLENINDVLYIKRLKFPRFVAKYSENSLNDLSEISWLDQEPDTLEIAKLLRLARAFLTNYLTKK